MTSIVSFPSDVLVSSYSCGNCSVSLRKMGVGSQICRLEVKCWLIWCIGVECRFSF